MGAEQSTVSNGPISDVAKNYSDLVDTIMTNQTGFASSMKHVSNAERKWFSEFETFVAQNKQDISTEDSLFRNIMAFVRMSNTDMDNILSQISDPVMRSSTEAVLSRTNRAVVLQKYYEYKYLHLSVVFLNFAEFVQEMFSIFTQSSVQLVKDNSDLTTRDVIQLLNVIAQSIPNTDPDAMQRNVSNVHSAINARVKGMTRNIQLLAKKGALSIQAFPEQNFREQRNEGNAKVQTPPTSMNPSVAPKATPVQNIMDAKASRPPVIGNDQNKNVQQVQAVPQPLPQPSSGDYDDYPHNNMDSDSNKNAYEPPETSYTKTDADNMYTNRDDDDDRFVFRQNEVSREGQSPSVTKDEVLREKKPLPDDAFMFGAGPLQKGKKSKKGKQKHITAKQGKNKQLKLYI